MLTSWLGKEEHNELVKLAWNDSAQGSTAHKITKKIKHVKVDTKVWSKKMPPIANQIGKQSDKLNSITSDLANDLEKEELIEEREKEKAALLELIEQEETTPRQQSRISWYGR